MIIRPTAPALRVRSDRATGSGPGYPNRLAVASTRSRRSADNWSGLLYALEMVVRETLSSAANEARVARRLGAGLLDMLPEASGSIW